MSTTNAARGEIVKNIAMGLGLAGVLAAAVVCPNLLQLIPREYRRRYSDRRVKFAIIRLDKKGFIHAQQTAKGWRISLTNKGRAEFLAYELGKKIIKKPKDWDKKCRLLIFDIPESKRPIRDKVRYLLRSLDFQRLQDSVWIYPYDCREVLDLLRTRYHIRWEAIHLVVDPFDNDRWLRKRFHLSLT